MADIQMTPVRLGGIPGQTSTATEVRVVGFNMPFLNLVGFFIKVALAAVPAAIIVAAIWTIVAAVLFGGITGGVLGRFTT
jgi:hypothetical protein